jgi:D-alanyl-D-alanine carboxypeptidase/D-alanyl-D-alanine-endopeptidase (penicillin-binding protein 4)
MVSRVLGASVGRIAAILTALLLVMAAGLNPRAARVAQSDASASAESGWRGSGPGRVPLVWHVETAEGDVVDSFAEDEPINPASVVKVATTLRALEVLGPEHRFETRFAIRGILNREAGTIEGDLVVLGGGDPDFHAENAFLVARRLRDAGVRRVTGRLVVDRAFWMGWEGGSARREKDPVRRAVQMATRLRTALDPQRWPKATRTTWTNFAKATGMRGATPVGVVIAGGVGVLEGPVPERVIVAHRSNFLQRILKRFNTHSNNDIERLEATIGSAEELALTLAARWKVPPESVRLATLSGLGVNRLSPRMIVRLFHDLRETCKRLGVSVEDLLPVAGCGTSTLRHYPGLRSGPADRVLAAKTGTLTETDGGVAVLAGVVQTGDGDRIFCTAAPRSGKGLFDARQAEARWVLSLIAGHASASRVGCPAPMGQSYDGVEVIAL